MNLVYIVVLFIMPVFLSGTISLLLRKNQIKIDIQRKYFTIKIINGIALIVSIYNLGFTFFWVQIHHEALPFYEISTLTKMTTLFYYALLPIDLLIFLYIIYRALQQFPKK